MVRARDFSDEDAKGMIHDKVQWHHFVCEGGVNGGFGLM